MSITRTLVMWAPHWPLVAAGIPPDQPAAVIGANRVLAATPAAREHQVSGGMRRREAQARCPDLIVMDNGPEFTSRALDAWAYENGVRLHFIQPGKPIQNCFVESFNGKFRDECLNGNWFGDVPHARRIIEAW